MTKRIVFDTDGVIADGMPAPHCRPRPGIRELFMVLKATGAEIHVWSGAGAAHARAVSKHCGLARFVTDYHNKDVYPMTVEGAIEQLGFDPDLTIDDDPHEALEGRDFMLMPLVPGWPRITRTSNRRLGAWTDPSYQRSAVQGEW